MLPGSPSASVTLSRYCCRNRSTSSLLNVGRRTTSARISIACGIFDDITPTVANDASQRAPESSEPPTLSICCAICVASRVCVPFVNRFAVISAKPANSGGSTSPPFLINNCAATSGVSWRSTTITRRPFGSVCSTGFGNVPERGGAGSGGVACGVCATAKTGRSVSSDKLNKSRFMLSASLLRLRGFRQVVQNEPVVLCKVFLHHSLNIGGSHRFQTPEIGIDALRVSIQNGRFSEGQR